VRGLIPRGEQFNPCRCVKGREFFQVTSYEALALEPEDIFAVLSELKQPEYEITLLRKSGTCLGNWPTRGRLPSI
jgi:hypothetical protein